MNMYLGNIIYHVIWECPSVDGMMMDIFDAEFEKPELNQERQLKNSERHI